MKLPENSDDAPYQNSIFKEGNVEKIKAEKEAIDTWNRLIPEIAPRVFSYHEKEGSASILMEFLDGRTLDEIILNADWRQINQVFETFFDSVAEVWLSTRKASPIKLDYIQQTKSRLPSVRDVHPDFFRFEKSLGKSQIHSSEALLGCARPPSRS